MEGRRKQVVSLIRTGSLKRFESSAEAFGDDDLTMAKSGKEQRFQIRFDTETTPRAIYLNEEECPKGNTVG